MANSEEEDVRCKGRQLWKALKNDPVDRKTIRQLLQDGAPPNYREPGLETNRTPLHFVVGDRCGDEVLMDMLLENGADANLGDCYDLTPLHLAAEKGDLQAVKTLLRNRYSLADCNKRTIHGNETPLQMAEKKGHEQVISYLLKEATKGEVSSDGVCVSQISTNSGSTVKVIGGKINLMVGDNNQMNLNQ